MTRHPAAAAPVREIGEKSDGQNRYLSHMPAPERRATLRAVAVPSPITSPYANGRASASGVIIAGAGWMAWRASAPDNPSPCPARSRMIPAFGRGGRAPGAGEDTP